MSESNFFEFSHSKNAEEGLHAETEALEKEGLSPDDAMRVAAATMDGAGEGHTVESMQTCRDLFGKPVKGMTTDDIPEEREDEFARTEGKRHAEAELGVDLASIWMTISRIKNGGLKAANKIARLVEKDEDQLDRFQDIIYILAVEKKWSDKDIVAVINNLPDEWTRGGLTK